MNKSFKQLIKDAHRIVLTPADHTAMRSHFTTLLGVGDIKPKTAWSSFFTLHRSMATSASFAVVAVLITSGVAAAAEGTIPGDLLYGVKVHVTEEIRSAIARTPATKAAWETRRLERRLTEAEKIIQKKPNPQALSSLELDINAHTERVQKSIDDMERSGNIQAAAEASSNIEAPLTAHKKILQELKKSKKETTRIIEAVEDSEHSVGARRQILEKSVDARDNKAQDADAATTGTAATHEASIIPNPDTSFSAKQRVRREKQEREVIYKAEKDIRIFMPREDKEQENKKPEESREKSGHRDQSR